MYQIKQSEATAVRRRLPILFVSSTDGFSPVTPTSPAAYISQNGGTWVATTNAVAVATLAAGQSASGAYYLELTATEVATLGWITVNVQATNARQYYAHIQVMAFDPYDVVRIGLTSIPNVAQGTVGSLPTASATGQVTVATNNDKTGYSLTQVFPTNFSSMAITAGGAVTAGTVSDKTGYSLSGTQTFNLTGSITGNLSGSVGSVTGAVGSVTGAVGSVTGNVGGSVGSVVGAVGSVTGNVGGNVTGSVGSFTATAIQSIWDDLTSNNTVAGSVGKLIVDNLNAPVGNNTPSLMWANATRLLTAGTNIVLAKGTGITGFNDISTTNIWSEALPGSYTSGQAGFKLNAAGSSADPWSTAVPGAYSAGSAGFIIGNNLNASISSRMATFTLPTNFSSLAISGTGAVTVGTNNDKTGYSLATAPPTASAIATQVWSETLPGTYTSGQAGFKLNAAGSAADPWSTAIPGSYTSGSAGFIIGNRLDAAITSRMATFTLPTNFSSMAITAGGAVTAGTVGDKTGYSLATSQTFNTTGSVGSVTSGVTVTTNNDKTGYSLVTAPLTSGQTASAVWDALLASYTTTNTFGARVVRSSTASITNDVTTNAAGHVAANVHQMQADVVTASALATSAVTEITQGIWNQARATASVAGGIPANGTFGFYIDKQLTTISGGGGGGSSVTVRQGPFTMQSEQDTVTGVVEALVGSDVPLQIQVGDGTGTPVPLSGTATISIKSYNSAGTLVETLSGTVDMAGLGYLSATFTTTTTATAGRYTLVAEVTDGTLVKYGGLQLLVKAL